MTAMDCPVCCQRWDLQGVRPKELPCRHSVCQSCVGRLGDQLCPTCRTAFVEPVPDNLALVACLESLAKDRPRVAWWCLDCQSASTARCMDEHRVRRPRAALEEGIETLIEQAKEVVERFVFMGDGFKRLQDGAGLAALRMLRALPATCKLTLRQDDGEAWGAEWRVAPQAFGADAVEWDGKEPPEDTMLRTLILALAVSDRLKPEPREAQHEAPSSAQQPAEERFAEYDFSCPTSFFPSFRERAETLLRVQKHGVRRMINLPCHYDPVWCLDLLRCAAPTVRELTVDLVHEEHLLVIHGMPRLRRLFLSAIPDLAASPLVLPALPQPSTLQCLRVEGLSRLTTQSLLQAHAASLDELWLGVGVGVPGREWPFGCSDLDVCLGQCGLRLSRLILNRLTMGSCGGREACRAQVAAVRGVLPGCSVQCEDCDEVDKGLARAGFAFNMGSIF